MNHNNVYYHEKIKSIPLENVRTMVEKELRAMLFDFGKKVQSPDPEFTYIVGRIVGILTAQYSDWEMMYFDVCMRNGMLDEYDKGQSITVKRLLVWLASYERTLKTSVFAKNSEAPEFKEFDLRRFAENGERFPQIILFRIDRKPQYDGDEWTLEEIEKTAEYQSWKRRNSIKPNINQNFLRKAV